MFHVEQFPFLLLIIAFHVKQLHSLRKKIIAYVSRETFKEKKRISVSRETHYIPCKSLLSQSKAGGLGQST